MDQLPLEFKLYMKGAHVGYECHVKAGYGDICIMHSINGKDWNNIQASNHRKDYYIQHDEKRQWTWHKDKNGEKIYFGDRLCYYDVINDKTDYYTAELNSLGCIVARHESIGQEWCPVHFDNMELVK